MFKKKKSNILLSFYVFIATFLGLLIIQKITGLKSENDIYLQSANWDEVINQIPLNLILSLVISIISYFNFRYIDKQNKEKEK